jgi:hypothetical protein
VYGFRVCLVRRSSCGVYAVALPLALLPLTTGLSAEDPETADRPRGVGDGNGVRVWRCRVQLIVQRAHGARRGTRARVPCPWTFMFIPQATSDRNVLRAGAMLAPLPSISKYRFSDRCTLPSHTYTHNKGRTPVVHTHAFSGSEH